MVPSDDNLQELRAACLKVAAAETSCFPEEYEWRRQAGQLVSPLDGHCVAVSLTLHGIFGGVILQGELEGSNHYWNRFPDGREVDLTSCQFGGDGFTPLGSGTVVSRGDLVGLETLFFAQRVLERLNELQNLHSS